MLAFYAISTRKKSVNLKIVESAPLNVRTRFQLDTFIGYYIHVTIRPDIWMDIRSNTYIIIKIGRDIYDNIPNVPTKYHVNPFIG